MVQTQKGDYKKLGSSVGVVRLGLGWSTEGYDGKNDFDTDAVAFVLTNDNKVQSDYDFLFYNNCVSANGAIKENTSARWETDCWEYYIDFHRLPNEAKSIVFAVTIMEPEKRFQHIGYFSDVYAYVEQISGEVDVERKIITRFALEEQLPPDKILKLCEFKRLGEYWYFGALAEGYRGDLLSLCKDFGVHV